MVIREITFSIKNMFLFNPLSASVALIETSQLLSGFYMGAALALNGLRFLRLVFWRFQGV